MRRRLRALILATTTLVVVALIVPLGLLVAEQAADRAKVAAQADAQQVAGVVALALAVDDDAAGLREAIGTLPAGTIVVLEDGQTIGLPRDGQGGLAGAAISSRSVLADSVGGGWEVAVPVLGVDTTVAVDSFTPSDQLNEGVIGSWALLGGLGVILIVVAVWIADAMGRTLVRPIEELAVSAHSLAEGQIETRVEPSDPDEIREVGEAFNYLAGRLTELLIEERESVADLSHRLRTPLTSLRLQAETLGGDADRAAMLEQVDRLERSMDDVIELTRSQAPNSQSGLSAIDTVVERRVAAWSVLADDQQRELEVVLAAGKSVVAVSEDDLEAVVDILIENVFSYTPVGSSLRVTTGFSGDSVWLEVADRGPGFESGATKRGVSGSGSTGLGLDIVRKTTGGVDVDDRPGGGAVVRVRFESA